MTEPTLRTSRGFAWALVILGFIMIVLENFGAGLISWAGAALFFLALTRLLEKN